jgi:hypothetical protein
MGREVPGCRGSGTSRPGRLHEPGPYGTGRRNAGCGDRAGPSGDGRQEHVDVAPPGREEGHRKAGPGHPDGGGCC